MPLSNAEREKIKELIKRRRYQIITHSYIYYRLKQRIISDDTFDKWSLELIQLQEAYPDISCEVEDLYNEFSEFTALTSAKFLPLDSDERLQARAIFLCSKEDF